MSDSQKATFAEIAAAMREHRKFAVFSHVRPDGDALGCQIAMGLCLARMGKEVRVWNEDGMLDKYRFLPCSDLVEKPPEEPEDFDVVFALDTAVENRLGNCRDKVKSRRLLVNIDHHVTNIGYGDMAHIDPAAPATGQILYELFRSQDLPFTYEMADNLFVAISTDTGSFQYPATTARTFEIGAELVKAGVNVGDLSQKIFESYPKRRIDLLRELLNVLEFSAGGRAASFALTLETARRLGAIPEDNEGLIDHIRAIEGVIVAAFIEELPGGKVRISLRSKDPAVNVSDICAGFGGGGHALAAGARLSGPLKEAKRRTLEAISHAIESA
jgi:phosphoesterase RecJ-like protein